MNPILITILVSIAVVLLLWIIISYNGLKKAVLKVQDAEMGIDVALTKRMDALGQMVEAMRGYDTEDERETLEKIEAFRKSVQLETATILEKQNISRQIDDAIRTLREVANKYPELKASEAYKTLQVMINDVDEHLQAARRVYNANVSSYNQKVQLFPSKIVAKLFRFTSREFFETEVFRRQDVDLRF